MNFYINNELCQNHFFPLENKFHGKRNFTKKIVVNNTSGKIDERWNFYIKTYNIKNSEDENNSIEIYNEDKHILKTRSQRLAKARPRQKQGHSVKMTDLDKKTEMKFVFRDNNNGGLAFAEDHWDHDNRTTTNCCYYPVSSRWSERFNFILKNRSYQSDHVNYY